MSDADRARKLRRRHMHERQAVVFGILLSFMALAFATAAGVYTGTLELPWAQRTFDAKPTPTETKPPAPCPPAGAVPVAAGTITVNVYNGAGTAGLAALTASSLTERGFLVGVTENATSRYTGTARVSFGLAGTAQAYTVAAHIPEAVLFLDGRADATVDVTLGSSFVSLKDPTAVGLDPAVPLVGAKYCVPFEQFTPTTPTATTTPVPAP